MYSNNNFSEEDSNIQADVMSKEQFTEKVLEYFKSVLKNSVHCRKKDLSDLVRRSREHFHSLLNDERLEDIYIEVLFSVFENFPFTSHKLIRAVLETYLLRKMRKYQHMRNELFRCLPLSESPLSYLHYYLEPSDEYMVIIAEYFCSSPMILDFSAMKRWLRYGGRFLIYPFETQFYLKNLLSCLTVKLLPLVYGNIQWDASKIIPAYETYEKQRRLYLVLLFLYVILQSDKPELFPEWRSYIRSLKLVFKSFTEPFITAQEIDRFLRVAAVGEIDEKVSEDLCKKISLQFPNIKEPFSPRSLKQISRCAVRDVLIRSKTLPHGVWYLDLPVRLKHYLLLQERSYEFYPDYVYTLRSRKRSKAVRRCCHGCAKRSRMQGCQFLRVAGVGEIDESVSEDLCKKFSLEFPNIKEPFCPRSLKQISRCAIRDVLIRSRTFLLRVWYLDLPMRLKHSPITIEIR